MKRSPKFEQSPWKAALALILIWIGVAANWNWLWGLFFLLWAAQALVSRVVFLIEPVERDRHPLLYWPITISWILLGLLFCVLDFVPSLGGTP